MAIRIRRLVPLSVALLTLLGIASFARAQQYPSRKIEVIVPWAAGGGTDQTARMLAEGFQRVLGVPAYVTNRVGGSGVVGHFTSSHAAPDGYTLGIMTVEIVTIAHLGLATVNHRDFEPVILYNNDAAALTVPAASPIHTLEEFITAARARPITIGNSGAGAIWHLAAAGFAAAADVPLRYVPYPGGAPAIQAALGGEIEAVSVSAVEVRPQTEAGKMRTLAVFSNERVPFMPDVPTLKERGIDFEMGAWRGLGAPKGTPPEIIATLAAALKQIYDSPEFQRMMNTAGFRMIYLGPAEYQVFLEEQWEAFGRIVQGLGLSH